MVCFKMKCLDTFRTIAEFNATVDVDLTSAGKLKLEPGVCIFHHLYAMNLAHQKTAIRLSPHVPMPPMCIKGKKQMHI